MSNVGSKHLKQVIKRLGNHSFWRDYWIRHGLFPIYSTIVCDVYIAFIEKHWTSLIVGGVHKKWFWVCWNSEVIKLGNQGGTKNILGHKKTFILFTKTTFMFSENKNLTPHNIKKRTWSPRGAIIGGFWGGGSPPGTPPRQNNNPPPGSLPQTDPRAQGLR